MKTLAPWTCLIALCGCDVYDGDLVPDPDVGAPVDMSVDTRDARVVDMSDAAVDDVGEADVVVDAPEDMVVDLGEPDAPPPMLRHAPERPDVPDDGDMVLTIALRDPVFDQTEDARWSDLGYDLDGVWTTVEDPVTECDSVRVVPDGEGGVDNVLGSHVLAYFVATYPELQRDAEEALADGDKTVVLRVTGYNGLPNDSRVQVAMVQSVGSTRTPGGEVGTPLWDGEDRFIINDRDFVDADPDRPRLIDTNAYVADGVLVARPPAGRSIEFPWADYIVEMKLGGAFLTAELDLETGRAENVILTGRWSLIDLADALTKANLCPGTSERFFADGMLRRYADIRGVPGSGGSGIECDALSGGVGFTGFLSQWDRIAPGDTPRIGCME